MLLTLYQITKDKHLTTRQNFTRVHLEAFADDTYKVSDKNGLFFDRTENLVGKGENAGYQHNLSFSNKVFKSYLLLGC